MPNSLTLQELRLAVAYLDRAINKKLLPDDKRMNSLELNEFILKILNTILNTKDTNLSPQNKLELIELKVQLATLILQDLKKTPPGTTNPQQEIKKAELIKELLNPIQDKLKLGVTESLIKQGDEAAIAQSGAATMIRLRSEKPQAHAGGDASTASVYPGIPTKPRRPVSQPTGKHHGEWPKALSGGAGGVKNPQTAIPRARAKVQLKETVEEYPIPSRKELNTKSHLPEESKGPGSGPLQEWEGKDKMKDNLHLYIFESTTKPIHRGPKKTTGYDVDPLDRSKETEQASIIAKYRAAADRLLAIFDRTGKIPDNLKRDTKSVFEKLLLSKKSDEESDLVRIKLIGKLQKDYPKLQDLDKVIEFSAGNKGEIPPPKPRR